MANNCDYCKKLVYITDGKIKKICPYICNGYTAFVPKNKESERLLKINRLNKNLV